VRPIGRTSPSPPYIAWTFRAVGDRD